MCSLELLELLEHMPSRGAFKTAARGGYWSEEERALFSTANDLAWVLAITAVYTGASDPYEPYQFTPDVEVEHEEEDLAADIEYAYSFMEEG